MTIGESMGTHARSLLRMSAFPLLFAGAGWVAWNAYAPAAATWLMPCVVLAVGLVAFGLERVIPYARSWNRGGGEATDASYLILSSLFAQLAEASVWASLALWFGSSLGHGPHLWPHDWPVVAQVFLAFAIGDFLPYLYHRASHESSGFLWRVHAIHHATERMYSLNFARFHPLNAFLTAALTLLPLAALGASAPVLFVAAVLHNIHGILSHANIDFRLGPLNAIFSMAEVHRWHHARDPRHSNGNYGATVLLWDWLFGTRRYPAARIGANAIGLWSTSVVPSGLLRQLGYPFAPVARLLQTLRAANRPCC